MVKNPPASAVDARDVGSIPGEGRCPEGGNGNPLQYSCLEIPWTEEPDRLEFIGLQRAGHNLATKQQKQLGNKTVQSSSVQSLSRVQLFVTPMDCSTPGLLVHHQLLEFTQTHVH